MGERTAVFVFVITTMVASCASQRIPEEILQMSLHPESVFAQKGLPAKPVSFRISAGPQDCQNRTLSCGGCSGVNQCAYLGGQYEYMAFSECDEKTPFCDQASGQCVAELSSYSQCPFPARARLPSFKCPNRREYNGYYPAPHSCDQYYVCADGVAYVFNCPSGYRYDPTSASCGNSRSYYSTCTGAFDKCSSDKNKYVFYDADPAVYAYCDARGTAHMSRCRPNYRIDPSHPERPCQPFCSAVGRFANADDPRGYYECYAATYSNSQEYSPAGSAKLSNPQEQWCPQGMAFSDTMKRCVSLTGNDEARPY